MAREPGGPRWETPDPPGVAGTYGNTAIAWAKRELGLTPDWWQARSIRKILRHDRKGDLIHRTALISTARQNGKSVVVRIIFGWLLIEGHQLPVFAGWTELLAAAHDAKQARLLYSGVYRDLLMIPTIKAANRPGQTGDRDVRLTEHFGITVRGLTLDTVTGQPGSSRGHAAGAVAWDEVLTQDDWEGYAALSPTQIAQRSPIMLMTSTAGFATSVVLRSFFDRLVRIAAGDEAPDSTFYGAWWQSEDPDAGWNRKAIKQANPSAGGRLPWAGIAAEYRILPSENWRRERLNHWVDEQADTAFNVGVWAKLRTPQPLKDVDPPFVLGIDVQPGWERATIVAAAQRPDGRIGAEVYRDLRDEQITVERLAAELDSFPEAVAAVIYDGVSGAAAGLDRHGVTRWGTEYRSLKPHQVVAACMDTTEIVLSGRLAVDDPLLDAQIAWTVRRGVGSEGAFRFTRTGSSGPIDAVMAMTLAVRGVAELLPAPTIT
jgi:hypothetical protein